MSEKTHTGLLLEEIEVSSADISQACCVSMDQVVALVAEGILEPVGDEPRNWRFEGASLTKVRAAVRLQADLGVNLAGIALALDLLEEIDALRARLRVSEIHESPHEHPK
jgi:chaperone modulatory protein CbpM